MNKQATPKSRGIEWTDYTWNPVAGCKHRCRWDMPDGTTAICYAESVAHGVAQTAYPQGFEAHYWKPKHLRRPLNKKTPAKIFMDSMADLMGHWVPDEQVQAVLDVCREANWHTFQLLTKNAPRLLNFDIPENVWVGVSVPPSQMLGHTLTNTQQGRMISRQLDVLSKISVPVRWMSIEPLSFDVAPLLADAPLEWVVIGAATNGRDVHQPQAAWVDNLLTLFDARGTKVFFKGNLDWPKDQWREEFPAAPGQTDRLI